MGPQQGSQTSAERALTVGPPDQAGPGAYRVGASHCGSGRRIAGRGVALRVMVALAGMRFQWDWLNPVVQTPYVPTLGPYVPKPSLRTCSRPWPWPGAHQNGAANKVLQARANAASERLYLSEGLTTLGFVSVRDLS
ncbi:hypothetical protein GCM10010411_89020 [Actinomadura fulvescens]|uniref:Uncharacterized protein n=1 Tax=Actinomadura fulvescens TaxID=46160 RepID=A0ABN3QVU2_9ACTN